MNGRRRWPGIRLAVAFAGSAVVGAVIGIWWLPRHDEASFWDHMYFKGVMAETFDSLESMASASDVVVVGMMTSLEKSRSWQAAPELGEDGIAFYALANVAVDQVLAGGFVPNATGGLDLEIFLPDWKRFDTMAAELPRERMMLFLRRQADMPPGTYRIVNVEQGYLRDLGLIGTPVGASDPWLLALKSRTFDTVASEVAGR